MVVGYKISRNSGFDRLGLNKQGQLGIGETGTKCSGPRQVFMLQDVAIQKVLYYSDAK
jgi:hypothetical protein